MFLLSVLILATQISALIRKFPNRVLSKLAKNEEHRWQQLDKQWD